MLPVAMDMEKALQSLPKISLPLFNGENVRVILFGLLFSSLGIHHHDDLGRTKFGIKVFLKFKKIWLEASSLGGLCLS